MFNQIRSTLYRVASILGWVNAIFGGSIGKRVARTGVMRIVARLIGRVR